MFSIQLNSRDCIKSIVFPTDDGKITIEGFLGKLKSLAVTEDIMLEINGCNGSIRMDLTAQKLQQLLKRNPKKPKISIKGV